MSGVRCHKRNHVLNSASNTVLVTPHVSKLKMLLLHKVILQKFKFKVLASARRDLNGTVCYFVFRLVVIDYRLIT